MGQSFLGGGEEEDIGGEKIKRKERANWTGLLHLSERWRNLEVRSVTAPSQLDYIVCGEE